MTLLSLNLIDILKDLRAIKLSSEDRAYVKQAQEALGKGGLSPEDEYKVRNLYHRKRAAIEVLHEARTKAQVSLATNDNPDKLKELARQRRIAEMYKRAEARKIAEETEAERIEKPLNPYGI